MAGNRKIYISPEKNQGMVGKVQVNAVVKDGFFDFKVAIQEKGYFFAVVTCIFKFVMPDQ
ncbi:MAG: hypothetical protein BWY80_01093 [Firmicutes bacterium ADurb.Bin456]|nr:MAG: hypothetical protein BWY80_01093 [Firmicutes bacterium ADurb.Bin456]